ncbi:MAG: glycosyltransferase family 87 protein [Beijerinckiaceae bacterium]
MLMTFALKTVGYVASLPWRVAGPIAIAFISFYLMWVRAGEFAATFRLTPEIVDFHAFYLSGLLANDGRLAEAYDISKLLQAQRDYLGAMLFMPWTYPPPFNLVTSGLAKLPFGSSYFLFTGASFASFMLVLWLIAPREFPRVLLLAVTSIIIMLICGQNGFLTASIVGLFALLYLRQSLWAGAVLGLMIFKPHLVIGIGLWLLLRRDTGQLLAASIVAIGLCLASTVAFGPAIWTSFLQATADASSSLIMGLYPLFRMTTVYAGLRSLGLPYGLAIAVHGAVALFMLCVIAACALRCKDPRTSLGVAVFASLYVSPYCYDYDKPMLIVAVALLSPILLHGRGAIFAWSLLAMTWLAGASGFVSGMPWSAPPTTKADLLSLGWIAMLGLAALVLSAVRHASRVQAESGGIVPGARVVAEPAR